MDIRKPKPIHSIQEFLIEIGTITIGILIALSLEAGVEAWHHHELIERSRIELRQELEDDRRTLALALASQRKVASNLSQLVRFTQARAARSAEAIPDVDLLLNSPTLRTAAWESAVATQVLTLMPFADTKALSLAYTSTKGYNEFQQETRAPWLELSVLLPSDPNDFSQDQLRSLKRSLLINRAYIITSIVTGDKLLKTYDKVLVQLG